ncbi:MAG: STAS domain-containing protein [Candidatus Latescibacterota bacterium]|nr:MAG: STAS domain-containing protein [Candidatus Latescibacterota bacterium]
MFEVRQTGDDRVLLVGKLDASQVQAARDVLGQLKKSCIVDFGELEYISSAGLGVLLGAQKRLGEAGASLKLVNMNRHIREIFRMAGFDHIFEIE